MYILYIPSIYIWKEIPNSKGIEEYINEWKWNGMKQKYKQINKNVKRRIQPEDVFFYMIEKSLEKSDFP